MSKKNLIKLLFFALFTSISPGSGAILSISNSLNYGWKKTSIIIIGEEIALGIIIILISILTKNVLLHSKYTIIIIKIISSFWLIYLGYKQWNTKIININFIKKKKNSIIKKFFNGFITNITNPKAIILMMTSIPRFIKKDKSIIIQTILISTIIMIIDGITMLIYAFIAYKFKIFLKNNKNVKILNRILGIIFIILAISIYI